MTTNTKRENTIEKGNRRTTTMVPFAALLVALGALGACGELPEFTEAPTANNPDTTAQSKTPAPPARPAKLYLVKAADGQSASIAEIGIDGGGTVMVKLPAGAVEGPADVVVFQDAKTPATAACRVTATDRLGELRLDACTGDAAIAPLVFAPASDTQAIGLGDTSAAAQTGSPSADDGYLYSVEGDNCRATCDYQWRIGIFACFFFNPTPGCYDQVNQGVVACYFYCGP